MPAGIEPDRQGADGNDLVGGASNLLENMPQLDVGAVFLSVDRPSLVDAFVLLASSSTAQLESLVLLE